MGHALLLVRAMGAGVRRGIHSATSKLDAQGPAELRLSGPTGARLTARRRQSRLDTGGIAHMNANEPRPDNWIWVDLETTTLDERTPADAHILEIGLIAVDAKLNEVAHWGSAIKFPRGDLADVLRRCGTFEMHQNSGLYGELTGPRAIREFAAGGLPDIREAEAVACQFVATFAPPVMQPRRDGQGEFMAAGSPLCGSNVGKFDWPWLREQMPKLAAMFHYRAYDTNFCFMSEQRFGGGPSTKGEVRHRAIDDCRQSIDTVRKFFGLLEVK